MSLTFFKVELGAGKVRAVYAYSQHVYAEVFEHFARAQHRRLLRSANGAQSARKNSYAAVFLVTDNSRHTFNRVNVRNKTLFGNEPSESKNRLELSTVKLLLRRYEVDAAFTHYALYESVVETRSVIDDKYQRFILIVVGLYVTYKFDTIRLVI